MHEHGVGVFWEEYLSILLDPAHFAAELTMTFLDILILSPLLLFIWKKVKMLVEARVQREHVALDAEHGVEHPSSPSD